MNGPLLGNQHLRALVEAAGWSWDLNGIISAEITISWENIGSPSCFVKIIKLIDGRRIENGDSMTMAHSTAMELLKVLGVTANHIVEVSIRLDMDEVASVTVRQHLLTDQLPQVIRLLETEHAR